MEGSLWFHCMRTNKQKITNCMLTNKQKKSLKFAFIFFIFLMTYRGWFQNCRMLFLQEYWLHQKPKARRKEKMIGCHNVIVLKHYLVSKNFILIKLLERGVNKVVYIFCYNNGLRNHSLPLDHELLIQYQFVRKRMCGQIVLVQKKEVRTVIIFYKL